MKQNIVELSEVGKQAQKRYRELNQLLETEMEARNSLVTDLKYHWLWAFVIL